MSDVISAPPALDQIVQKYMALRERKAVLKKEYDSKLEPIDAAMERCEAFLLNTLNGMGVDAVKTQYGTPYTKTVTSATVADWPMVLNFIKEKELWHMLERRVSKTVVEAFKEEHNDLPPGINWTETRVLNIRKS